VTRLRQSCLACVFLLLFPSSARADTTFADLFAHRILAYSGQVSLDPTTGSTSASIHVETRVLAADLTRLLFAVPLPILAVRDALGEEVPVSTEGDYLSVPLGSALAPGTIAAFDFDLAGTPTCDLPGGRKACRFGDVAWMDLARLLPASPSGVFATLDLDVEVPAGLDVVSSIPAEAPVSASPGRERHRIVQAYPTALHGLWIGASEQSVHELPSGAIRTYTLPEPAVRDSLVRVVQEAASARAFFTGLWGPLPHADLSMAQIPPDSGAAMAFPGLVLLPTGIWTGEGGGTLHPPDQWDVVLPHELAHQWFTIFVRAAPFAGGWPSEGLAEYSALRYLGSVRGEAWTREAFGRWSLLYRRGVPAPDDYPLGLAGLIAGKPPGFATLYYKGAVVARTIAAAAGDDAFLAAMRGLVDDLAGTEDACDLAVLRLRLEQACGSDLGATFDTWLGRAGFPVFRVRASQAGEGGIVQVRVEEVGPGFALAVPFRLESTVTTLDLTEPVGPGTTVFSRILPGRLLGVHVDPEETFVHRVLPGLPGDLDLSGEVDGIDLVSVANAMGTAFPSPGYREAADQDDDGDVDAEDLGVVAAGFGATDVL
jgi:hypothetical protein